MMKAVRNGQLKMLCYSGVKEKRLGKLGEKRDRWCIQNIFLWQSFR